MRMLRKFVRKLYHLIWFLSIFIFFLPIVKADSYGGALNTDISSPFRALAFDNYGSYWRPSQNSQYFFVTPFGVNCQYGNNVCGWAFETQQSYAAGHYYGITIYLHYENRSLRIVPPPSGARRIGMGNSMNAARVNYVNNSNDVSQVIYTNYSYDAFDIKLTNNNSYSGVYSITYFFKTITNNIGLAVPFSVDGSVNTTSNYYFVGYYLTDLGTADGLTESQVTHAIQNSGLATASSVNEVQRSVNEVKQELNGVKEAQQETNDTLKDDSVSSSDDTINNLKDKIPTNSVISDLLLLPVRFLQNFVNALDTSCSNFSLGSLYGTELFMPCINIENYLGTAIWTTIDLIISGMFVYALRKKFIQIYENLTNLKNGGNEVD